MNTKTTLLILFTVLTVSAKSVATTNENKYAFLTSAESIETIQDDDELAAASWFKTYYLSGDVISAVSIKNNSVDLSQYNVIWIHIDKENGTGEIPLIFKDPDVISRIKNYYKNGGNLFLTNHATQYLTSLGRTTRSPGIIDTGIATNSPDVWTVNPNIGMTNNYFSHPIYSGLSITNITFPHTTIPLLGSGLKENHNSMWDLNAYGYTGNVVNAFEKENSSRVIGTWGQVTDYCCAGIVEFLPTPEFRGNVIAIGLGAYEWNQNDKTNAYQLNIRRLTTNTFSYLSSYISGPLVTPQIVAHFPMELNETLSSIKEIYGNRTFTVENSKSIRESIPGAEGNALRFDGFSTFIRGRFNNTELSTQAFSTSVWCALEAYPMMHIDGADDTPTFIAGNMNTESGFAFTINSHGKYGFEVFINGVKLKCYAPDKFPKYEWVNLSAVVSARQQEIQLYKNNELIAKTYIKTTELNTGSGTFYIGKSYDDVNRWVGPFRINTINGLVDDIRIYSGEQNFTSAKQIPEHEADLSIPHIRYKDEIQRPLFHGMPGANWTNEPHGLVYYNNKYHLFFQKNGNGPYWGRIHWGHITSDDLITWKEEKTAIDPLSFYDIKGAWSGCVYSDPELTNGLPYIYYTAADLGKTSIAEARPLDANLLNWEKVANNPIIPNRPQGLDEDFRDPFIFKSNGTFYMIVGARKNGRGATTLHQYNPTTKSWSNDGRIFYQATSTDYGVFWEMPVIIPMNDGKWLFVATPLGGKNGVETLYWVGTINTDGTFNPYSHTPKEVELSNMSKDGFGLLSPSVLQKDGKNIVIGIVPDKLGGDDNKRMGWAHLFNLPREWSLDINNNLVQKPYEGLKSMRTNAISYSTINQNLSGTQSLEPVNGKAAEIEGIFTVSTDPNQKFGFNVRKNGENAIKIFYEPASNRFTVDARAVNRYSNDGWLYNGLYVSTLPETIPVGQTLKIHAFIDHSIMDIFINNKWAFSIRIFPTDMNSNGIEVFSEGTTTFVNSVKAWKLSGDDFTGIEKKSINNPSNIYFADNELVFENLPANSLLNVYDSTGRLIVNNVQPENYKGTNLQKKNIYMFQIIAEGKNSIVKVIKY